MEISLLCLALPLLSGLFLALPWKFSEKFVSYLTLTTLVTSLFGGIFLFVMLQDQGFNPFEIALSSITISHHSFPLLFWVDIYGLSYLLLTVILGLVVIKFSHSYLHLEVGYQRYFSVILFFIFGLSLLSIAGHLDLFFAGWEIVGMSSFLLISFYRSHIRSVNNAWRIYSIYRICDIGLLSSAVLGHVMWKEATTFSILNEMSAHQVQEYHSLAFLIFSLCVVIASLGKSAQFPFYNWPAKAMEGPTPSSAIFYGALSIHAGLLLLIRTQVVWDSSFPAKSLVIGTGVLTFILSFLQKKVQTNIKGRMAYAITSHLGVMYVLMGLGFKDVVFIYMILHAIYRCFEMLISPSIVASSELSNNKKVISKIEKRKTFTENLSEKWRSTLYLFTSLDFGMDISGRGMNFFHWKKIIILLKVLVGGRQTGFILSALIALFAFWNVTGSYYYLSVFSFLLILRSMFYHRSSFLMSMDIMISLAGILISFSKIHDHSVEIIADYLLPVVPAMLIIVGVSFFFRSKDLRYYHGEGTKHSLLANSFFISFLVISGMPISSAFVSEDILLEILVEHQPILAVLTLLVMMMIGIILSKMYTRIFMGRPSF